ncbi:MAG: hypothetical protein WAN60_21400 [Candidatus Sulfotelmatobacter sp.]
MLSPKVAAITVGCCFVLLILVTAAASADDPCALPVGLREEISKDYPQGKVVRLSDLSEDDRNFFRKDHGNACPGLAEVDFYGDKKPTWAVALLEKGTKFKVELVVAHQAEKVWEIKSLDSEKGDVPVVWRQNPGKYDDIYGEKTIRATKPVIVFCAYEAWAILYAWTGKSVDKIWLSD